MIVTNYTQWKRVNESEDEEFDFGNIDLDNLDLDKYNIGDDGDKDVRDTLGIGDAINLIIDCSSGIDTDDIEYTLKNHVFRDESPLSINLIIVSHEIIVNESLPNIKLDNIMAIVQHHRVSGLGGNVDVAYKEVIKNRWIGNKTFVITDGYIRDHNEISIAELAKPVFKHKDSKFLIIGALKGDFSAEMERRLVYPIEKVHPPE